jgi:hypothetical protein
MAVLPGLEENPDFSLVLGGPLYQIFRWAHLSGPALELVRRRILFFVAIAWLPLLLLSLMTGHLLGGQGLPFLRDIETHVRFLVSLPVLVITELPVHRRIRSVMKQFLERGIVTAWDVPKFHAALKRAMSLRNSTTLELGLLVFAFTVGHWGWERGVALGTATWYGVREGTNLRLTLPGDWYAFVSIPIAQFIVFRWYLRLFIWFWLLWRVSRLNLQLVPTHPDRAGGIGFLGGIVYPFAPLLFAQNALLAGVIANRVLHQGQSLMSSKMSILGLIGFFVLMILVPLTVFSPQLFRAKMRGLSEYGALATSYVRDFEEKWVLGGAREETILGTADIQSLADLANSYAVVSAMRLVPFALGDAIILVGTTAMPLLPLLLTTMSADELLSRLVKLVF